MTRASDTLLAGAGFLLWAACFIALYGLLSISCMSPTLGLPAMRPQAVTGTLAIVWALFMTAHLTALVASARRHRAAVGAEAFVLRIGVYLNTAALAATVVVGAPVLALPPCQ
ncbi:MAG: hypothetical protein ACK4MV_12940 [Beijerinckiaceae bacterium]